MRILLVHNYYQLAGGEGLVFRAEVDLLKARGHTVFEYTAHNDRLASAGAIETAVTTVWNREAYQDLRDLVEQQRIQVVHFHNTFPLISPAAYYAAKAAGAAVVQTLHNYRLLCPNALFFREGSVCEDCLGKAIPWPGIVHKCYRNSLVASSAVSAVLTLHRAAKTWRNQVDAYIALTAFAKEKLIQGGIPESLIRIKPNFIDPDPGYQPQPGKYALYVGRLSVEKGIDTMLTAWAKLGQTLPLKIIGDGPLASDVEQAARDYPGIEWLGRRPSEVVYQAMKDALFLVVPSKWYEGLPRTIVESFAVGTPVLASNLGAMSSLIRPDITGWHFEAGNAQDLARVAMQRIAHKGDASTIRQTTRDAFESDYCADKNYEKLLEIYSAVT